MTTPEQWASKMIAEVVRRPTARHEIAAKYFRAAFNEALEAAAQRLSEIRYCKPYSTEPARPEERVRDLKCADPAAIETSSPEPLYFEEPQFSEDGSVGIYPTGNNYEVMFRGNGPEVQKVVVDDRALIFLADVYFHVRSNRRG